MIFVTGGARSGKSSVAEQMAAARGGQVTYIATAEGGDAEMRTRIAGHRERRPEQWRTVEAFSDLPAAVEEASAAGGTVLVDCLTVYISNLLMRQGLDAGGRLGQLVDAEMGRLVELANGPDADGEGPAGNGSGLIIVSNEVGMGIVPDNALARAFRDIAGRANQKLAAAAEEVYLCVSGIPVRIK